MLMRERCPTPMAASTRRQPVPSSPVSCLSRSAAYCLQNTEHLPPSPVPGGKFPPKEFPTRFHADRQRPSRRARAGIDDPIAAGRCFVHRPAPPAPGGPNTSPGFLQSQPTPDHRWILPQIEDGCHDEPVAVDAVEDAVHEPSHEQTPKFTGVTGRRLGKLCGDVQCAPHCAIETIPSPGINSS